MYLFCTCISQGTEGTHLLPFACDFSHISVPFCIGCVTSVGKTLKKKYYHTIELKKLAEYISLEVTEAVAAGPAERNFILSQVVLLTLPRLPTLIRNFLNNTCTIEEKSSLKNHVSRPLMQ